MNQQSWWLFLIRGIKHVWPRKMSSNHELLFTFYIYSLDIRLLMTFSLLQDPSSSPWYWLCSSISKSSPHSRRWPAGGSRSRQIHQEARVRGQNRYIKTLWLGLVYEWGVVCLHFSQTALVLYALWPGIESGKWE